MMTGLGVLVRAALLLGIGAGLAACEPQAPDGSPAPPPADASPAIAPPTVAPASKAASTPALAPELFADLDARGTEPFWAVSIRKNQLVLTRPDHPEIKTAAATPQMVGDKAVWSAQFDGGALMVSIWKQACSDGMSDRDYPLTAEVKVAEVSLKGCAAPTAAK